MSRKLLGIIAAVLLVLGGITAFAGPGGNSANGFAGGCIRVGLVLGALWLALPQIQTTIKRLPGWVAAWFLGKNKPPPQTTPGGPPAPPIKRPRRRSRS